MFSVLQAEVPHNVENSSPLLGLAIDTETHYSITPSSISVDAAPSPGVYNPKASLAKHPSQEHLIQVLISIFIFKY